MQLFCLLALLATAECTFWGSLFGTSRHDGLEASAGFLRLKALDKTEEPVKMDKPRIMREELPRTAEVSGTVTGLNASQTKSENATKIVVEELVNQTVATKRESRASKRRAQRSQEGNLIE